MIFLKKKYGKYILMGIAAVLLSFIIIQNNRAFRFIARNLFYKTNIKIEDTILRIKEVNGISQWITSEYYGETIYSLEEYKSEIQNRDSLEFVKYQNITSLGQFYIWKNSLEVLYQDWHRKLANSGISNEQYMDTLEEIPMFIDLHFLLGFDEEKKTVDFIKKQPLNSKKYRNKLNWVLSKKENELHPSPPKDLVLMGRGWVKAGFNLDEIQKAKLQTEKREDTLFLKGMPAPYIITSSINPWFIPDKLKGYEIVFEQGNRKLTSEDIKQVKMGCLNKLEKEALESGLLEQAWISEVLPNCWTKTSRQ